MNSWIGEFPQTLLIQAGQSETPKNIIQSQQIDSFIFFLCFTAPFLYHDETLELMMHRWTKLEKV